MMQAMGEAPQQVVRSTWVNTFLRDTDAPAAAVKVPVLYVDAGAPNCDLARFKSLTPQLVTGGLSPRPRKESSRAPIRWV